MDSKLLKETIAEIKDVIESIRFYVNQDGGDLEYVDFDGNSGIVTIRILGNCVGCPLIDLTYKDGLEVILKNEVPGVNGVDILEENMEDNEVKMPSQNHF